MKLTAKIKKNKGCYLVEMKRTNMTYGRKL